MQTIKKIIITISKKNKDLPAYIFYQNNTEIQKSFHLDTETTEQAKEFLKIIKKNYYINETNCKIYCYDYNNKKIITIDSITEVNNHYLVGSNIEGITDLIRMIKTNCNKCASRYT